MNNNFDNSSLQDKNIISVQDQVSSEKVAITPVITADAQKPAGSTWKERNTRRFGRRKTHKAGA